MPRSSENNHFHLRPASCQPIETNLSDRPRDSSMSATAPSSSAASKDPFANLVSPSQWKTIAAILQLSTRERQVCRLVFQAKTRNEIAAQLKIKPRTVRQYMEQIHIKLNVTNRIHLVLKIIQTRDGMTADQQGDRQNGQCDVDTLSPDGQRLKNP